MQTITNTRDFKQAYETNQYIGFIYFTGGLVREQRDIGVQVSTKTIELKNQKELIEMAENGILNVLESEVKNKFLVSSRITLEKPFQSVKSRKDYNPTEDNGQDNLNNPRIVYEMEIDRSSLPKSSEGDFLIIPIVQYYYAHNAGWFIGQDWGCMAGVRLGVQFLIYDLNSQELVFDGFSDKKWLANMKPSLNASDYFVQLENLNKKVQEDLREILK
ncbi:MAG: hypothetical protein MH321_11075 [Leptospiraceae bacterium]|nr:hypothetical protein [Leptospiraceae bacterium]